MPNGYRIYQWQLYELYAYVEYDDDDGDDDDDDDDVEDMMMLLASFRPHPKKTGDLNYKHEGLSSNNWGARQ